MVGRRPRALRAGLALDRGRRRRGRDDLHRTWRRGEVTPAIVAAAAHGLRRVLAGAGILEALPRHPARTAARVAFFDAGQVVETGPARQVITEPRQARTKAFLTAVR
ncbi:hypothetical protein [Streptomyces sp. NPDC002403]